MSRTRKRKMRNKPYSWTILNKNLENWKNKSLLCHSELGICKEIYEEAMIMTFVYITKRKLPQTKSVVFFFYYYYSVSRQTTLIEYGTNMQIIIESQKRQKKKKRIAFLRSFEKNQLNPKEYKRIWQRYMLVIL